MLKIILRMKGLWALLGISSVIAAILFICFACTGCRTTKSIVSNRDSFAKSDSAVTAKKTTTKESFSNKVVETEEMNGTLSGRAKLHLTPIDLVPVYTSVGVRVPRYFFTDSGNTSVSMTLNPDGSADIDCKTDSLVRVIKRLEDNNQRLENSNDSSYTAGKEMAYRLQEKTEVEVIEPVAKGLWSAIWGAIKQFADIIIAFVLGTGFGIVLNIICKIEKAKNGLI